MNILMVTNRVKTYALGFKNVIEPFETLNHKVIWAADFSNFVGDAKKEIPCEIRQIPITSNPLKLQNGRAYKELLRIIDEDKIDMVYCSTPIGGMIARLAARKKKITPVIYAAHGFLFFRGAPLVNRTLYKWQEIVMAKYTDTIITITDEDFAAAKQFSLRNQGQVFLVHGAGVDTEVTLTSTREAKRQELNLTEDDFVICSAGFLNKNKNNMVVVRAIAKLNNPRVKYLICGEGDEKENLLKTARENGIEDQIVFLGYRTDMQDIMNASDLFAMPSFREGVPRALLEAMNLGLPCIGSDTRGIRELIGQENAICLCDPRSPDAYAKAIEAIMSDLDLVKRLKERNQKETAKYSSETVKSELLEIYKNIL